jgi:hypothetical protein
MTQFGRRDLQQVQQKTEEDKMSFSDRLVLSPKMPLYLAAVMIAGIFLPSQFTSVLVGRFDFGSLLGSIAPMAFLSVAFYFILKSMQKKYAADRAKQRQLAKYPQLYFWGAAGGILAFSFFTPFTLGELLTSAKDSFGTQSISSVGGDGAGMLKGELFMDFFKWLGGGLAVAHVATKVLDWYKESAE